MEERNAQRKPGILENVIPTVRNEFLKGKPVIVIDREREMEGDFVFPAQICTTEVMNFITTVGKGLLCVVGPEEELIKRGFFRLPSNFNANYFIPIDYIDVSSGYKTGIPAYERALTCRMFSDEKLNLSEFKYPGHVTVIGAKEFPLRKGHSEASVELARLAGFKPYSVIIEILDNNGDSHNLDYLYEISEEYKLLVLDINDIWNMYVKNEQLIKPLATAKLPTKYGMFEIVSFHNLLDSKEHFAVIKDWGDKTPMVRIHSECVTGDTLSSLRCDCGSQLEKALKIIAEHGGVLVYLRQEGRGIGISRKIEAYRLQDSGLDTYDANVEIGRKPDEREYGAAYQILTSLGINKVKLLTNNPHKRQELEKYGIIVEDVVNLHGEVTEFNLNYLLTKKIRFKHDIKL
ncbi:MAG: bifunctional 3,4-dihydroxy-2-butanone-4-phosphate synthase/GTP cyclohydrolase II [Fervidobacterium sp.]|uniref:bifunctional 3,4-dihydroxy-2-butanone-4-phosphate synthase/GTP cyclohydrolase II n=1 Tax=Fervidobacterium sp. TaxID=1871331 RepID=UPI004049320A